MHRRTVLGIVSLTLFLGGLALAQEPRPDRRIAVTFDDLPFGGPDLGLSRIRAENEAILATLRREGVPATDRLEAGARAAGGGSEGIWPDYGVLGSRSRRSLSMFSRVTRSRAAWASSMLRNLKTPRG